MQRLTIALSLVTLVALPLACEKKDKGTKNPDEASDSDKDPMAELQGIPGQIQAEVDLQPYTWISADHEEGKLAFREKRKPQFRGR